jgi:hypothetical protein
MAYLSWGDVSMTARITRLGKKEKFLICTGRHMQSREMGVPHGSEY